MNTCENKLMTIFERKKFDFLAQKFKETGQIPGPNFHLSEKVQNVHITIFVKIVVFYRKCIIRLCKTHKMDGNVSIKIPITSRKNQKRFVNVVMHR